MKRILVVGNGAREHAIIKALSQTKDIEIFNCASGINPGIKPLAKEIFIGDIMDFAFLEESAKSCDPDYAVVGPDDPIGKGASDTLISMGIPTYAPKQSSARIESSKGFARDIVQEAIPSALPRYFVCKSAQDVRHAVDSLNAEYVVKADGLMGGKGVIVMGEHFDDFDTALMFAEKGIERFGQVVIEEKLIGVEFSLMSFVSNKTVIDMPVIQDHKRAYEGDTGPNTGGMGTYSDANHLLPFLTKEDVAAAHEINVKTATMLREKTDEIYNGILYGGFMLTENGVKLIEYNSRFGDPEAMNALSLLKTPLFEIIEASLTNTLESVDVSFEQQATVLKYAVPEGYPSNPVKGKEITIDYAALPDNAELYYASVHEENGKIFMSSSRAVAVLGKGTSIPEAEQIAEEAIRAIHGPVFYRKDIGTAKLIEQRIDMVDSWN